MLDIDKSKPVLVTGATGYVAGWIVKRLLEEGVTVHAAVRDPSKTDKLKYLNDLAAELPGTIHFFKADLLDQGSYKAAMAGCGVVFHTASPFTMDVKDPQKELIDPALLGTSNVLNTACETPSVHRVVLTSSVAAVYGDCADLANTSKGVFTEDDWNASSSLEHLPYSYSKMLAEREAWEIAGKQAQWDLVVINPGLVIGPGINPYATSESFHMVKQYGNGKFIIGVPAIGITVVDVRDVAEAHLRAAFMPEAKGRYITTAHDTSMTGMGRALLPKYKKYPIPRNKVYKFLMMIVGSLVDPSTTRKFISRNVDLPVKMDNRKSREELKIEYRPLEVSMQEMFQQLIDSGQLRAR